MNTITKELLGLVSDLFDKPNGAYNIREDSGCAGRNPPKTLRSNPNWASRGLISSSSPELTMKMSISPPASPTAMWMIWSITISM